MLIGSIPINQIFKGIEGDNYNEFLIEFEKFLDVIVVEVKHFSKEKQKLIFQNYSLLKLINNKEKEFISIVEEKLEYMNSSVLLSYYEIKKIIIDEKNFSEVLNIDNSDNFVSYYLSQLHNEKSNDKIIHLIEKNDLLIKMPNIALYHYYEAMLVLNPEEVMEKIKSEEKHEIKLLYLEYLSNNSIDKKV